MPRITVRPHPELCPDGAEFEARQGSFLCDALERNGVALEHACDKSCACATCHVIVQEGFDTLPPPCEDEEDQLDRAWGVQPNSRLACQVALQSDDLTIEMPRYTRNLARERN